jgi:O-antigen chain-terminating methyltransferase
VSEVDDNAGCRELKDKLGEEERVYAELLAELDSLAVNPLPYELDPDLPTLVGRLNEHLGGRTAAAAESPAGLKGLIRRIFRKLIEPELAPLRDGLAEQRSFNSFLVQFLNRYLDASHRRAARLSELTSTLVRFTQRIDRLADAKDRLYAALGNTRTDLLLEAMEKRLETVTLGLKRARDRMEGMAASLELAATELASLKRAGATGRPGGDATAPASSPAAAPWGVTEYVAFENRFRGSSEDIRDRLRAYVPHFEGLSPVVELGCGRGEFLELLGQAGVAARGVDNNAEMVALCRDKGLSVEEAELTAYLDELPAEGTGGIFAAQVIEHLPPPALRAALLACHSALRRGGRLVVETINPRSIVALVESFYRDLTHVKPLHPETLDFLLRACGFREVTIQYSSPVAERTKLVSVPADDDTARTLNENFRKLNAFLFGAQDYAAVATK